MITMVGSLLFQWFSTLNKGTSVSNEPSVTSASPMKCWVIGVNYYNPYFTRPQRPRRVSATRARTRIDSLAWSSHDCARARHMPWFPGALTNIPRQLHTRPSASLLHPSDDHYCIVTVTVLVVQAHHPVSQSVSHQTQNNHDPMNLDTECSQSINRPIHSLGRQTWRPEPLTEWTNTFVNINVDQPLWVHPNWIDKFNKSSHQVSLSSQPTNEQTKTDNIDDDNVQLDVKMVSLI